MPGWSIPVVTGDDFLAPMYSAQFPPAVTVAYLGPAGKELHPLPSRERELPRCCKSYTKLFIKREGTPRCGKSLQRPLPRKCPPPRCRLNTLGPHGPLPCAIGALA